MITPETDDDDDKRAIVQNERLERFLAQLNDDGVTLTRL